MGVTRIVEVVRQCPWVKPLFLRVALSTIILLYIITGAAIFVVMVPSSSRDTFTSDRLAPIRNDTAKLLVTELQIEDVERATQLAHGFLMTYEREIERIRAANPVDELLISAENSESHHKVYRENNFENSLYFTLSLITATASGNLLRLPETTQFIVILYTAVGVPLFLIWICLMGRSMAQFWIMLCLHSCCCGMSPAERAEISLFRRMFSRFSRRQSVTPESIANAKAKAYPFAASTPVSIIDDLVASERNVLVQPENLDEYFRLVREDLAMPIWTLSLFFLLYAIFGATFGAVSHGTSFMTAFFYGYLIFTTIGGVTPNLGLTTSSISHLTRFSGDDMFTFIVIQQDRAAKVIWMLFFLIGYVILSGIIYLAYLYLTWRCSFCRRTLDETTEKCSVDLTRSSEKSTIAEEFMPKKRASTPGLVLMGRKMVESRRTSAETVRQTTIELNTPEIEDELMTLAEVSEETQSHTSDSGISKTSSERLVEEQPQKTVRSGRGTRNERRSFDSRSSMKSREAFSSRSKHSSKTDDSNSIEEDIRDEKEPEGIMTATEFDHDNPVEQHVPPVQEAASGKDEHDKHLDKRNSERAKMLENDEQIEDGESKPIEPV